jgi:MFS family permease
MARARVFYGWVIVGVSFITIAAAYATRYSFTIFYVAMLKDLGWSRASLAGAFSLAMLIYGLFSPFIGGLMDRFGPRRLFPLATLILVLGMVTSGYIQSPWHFYLTYGVLVTLGLNGLGPVPHAPIISNWFILKRGLASGIIMVGCGIGTVFSPLIQQMISLWGWRGAFSILGVIVASLVFPLTVIFQRLHPREKGLYSDGLKLEDMERLRKAYGTGTDVSSIDPVWTSQDWTVHRAIRTIRFWSLFLANVNFGFFMGTILVHQAPFIVDAGFSRMFAATILALTGLANAGGNFFWGILSDRIGREWAWTLASGSAFLSILLLIVVKGTSNPWVLYGHGILFGLGYALPSLWQGIAGDLFQGKQYGAIFGLITIGFGMGNFLGPWLGGYLFDIQGTYTIVLILCLATTLLSTLFIWVAGPRQVRMVGGKVLKTA